MPDGARHTSSRHIRSTVEQHRKAVCFFQVQLGSPNLAEQMWLFLNAKPFLINGLNNVHFATSHQFVFSDWTRLPATLPQLYRLIPRLLTSPVPTCLLWSSGVLLRKENVENLDHTLFRALTSCTHETLLWQTTNFLFAVSSCGCRMKATGSF